MDSSALLLLVVLVACTFALSGATVNSTCVGSILVDGDPTSSKGGIIKKGITVPQLERDLSDIVKNAANCQQHKDDCFKQLEAQKVSTN